MMNPSPIVNKKDVEKAVNTAIGHLPEDVRNTLGLVPVPGSISSTSEGDWIVPVASHSSDAMKKSYQLHRVLSDLQNEVETKLGAFVTFVLAA